MTLAEFLLARITEDEALARAAIGSAVFQRQTAHWTFEHVTDQYGPIPLVFAVGEGGGKTQVARLDEAWEREERGHHIARWDPARVLAECEAKRRIVALHEPVHAAPGRREITCVEDGTVDWPCTTVRLLALPYADHPDYREEWRP